MCKPHYPWRGLLLLSAGAFTLSFLLPPSHGGDGYITTVMVLRVYSPGFFVMGLGWWRQERRELIDYMAYHLVHGDE